MAKSWASLNPLSSWQTPTLPQSSFVPVVRPARGLLETMLLLCPTQSLRVCTRLLTRNFADRRFSLTASFLGRTAARREGSRLRVQPCSVMASSEATAAVAEAAAPAGTSRTEQQPDSDALLERFLTEQQHVARMAPADEARTLIALGGHEPGNPDPHIECCSRHAMSFICCKPWRGFTHRWAELGGPQTHASHVL